MRTLAAALVPFALTAITSSVNAQQVVWTQSSINGHWYTLVMGDGSWCDQEAIAQSYGGHLATVRDALELGWIAQEFGQAASYIGLGASDVAQEGTWVWASGEPFVHYPNDPLAWNPWNGGEPNNGPATGQGLEHHLYMEAVNGWVWNDACGCCAPDGTHWGLVEVVSGDCDQDLLPDVYEIATGRDFDCNANGIADSCEIALGTSIDCDGNGVPDECQPDCNANGIADSCDISSSFSLDCNGNGVPDECDLASGHSTDFDSNGIPDDCVAPLLNTNRTQASVTTGAQVQLTLRAGAASALDVFVILGSASGTVPGLADPVTGLVLPLNFDPYFELLYVSSGAGIVAPFFGFLDANGNATATVTVPAATNPSLVGLHLDHAYLTIDLFGTGLMGLASNPVPLEHTL
jgi:hypothetical protein